MTEAEISLETLISARRTVMEEIRSALTASSRAFLLSLYLPEPQWDLLAVAGVDQLPAVKWRELNLDWAGKNTRVAIVGKLEEILSTENPH